MNRKKREERKGNAKKALETKTLSALSLRFSRLLVRLGLPADGSYAIAFRKTSAIRLTPSSILSGELVE